MTSIKYRGHKIAKVSKRNSNLKWQVRILGDLEPIRFRTHMDAIAYIDRIEDDRWAKAQ